MRTKLYAAFSTRRQETKTSALSAVRNDTNRLHFLKYPLAAKKHKTTMVFCLFMANAVWPTVLPKIIDFPGGHAYYLCGLEIDPQVNTSQTRTR